MRMRTRAVLALAGLGLGGAGLWVWSALWTPVPEGLPPHTAASPGVAAEITPPVSTRFLPPVVRLEPAPVEVAVDRAGRIRLRGREIRENLLAALQRETLLPTPNGLVAPDVPAPLLIRADAAARWEDVEAVLEAASHPLLDIPVRFLDMLEPFRRAGRHRSMAFPPEVPLHPVAEGYAGDDGHAVFLPAVAGVAIVLLCLFGGPPTELSLLFALKLPAAFFIATGLFAIGRDSVRQWAIPLTGALLLWLFARPRLVRWSAPSLLAFAALLLSLDLAAVLRKREFVGDPARPAEQFEPPSTREERLWHVASVIEGLDAKAPEGPLLESPLARRLSAWDRRFLERAGLVEVKAAPRWHTFFTGLHRVVPACPDLVVWYPGGPAAREAADRLSFRRYPGSTPSRVNTKE